MGFSELAIYSIQSDSQFGAICLNGNSQKKLRQSNMQHDYAAPSATNEDVAAVEHLKKSYARKYA